MKLLKTCYDLNTGGTGPGLPGGFRLAVLADFHNGDPAGIIEILRNDVPDAIMIPGDLISGYDTNGCEYIMDKCRNILPLLEGCIETAPVFMSVGNHECMLCDEEYNRLKGTGITLLDNEWTELRAGSGDDPAGRILIGGLTSAYALTYRRFRDDYNRGKSGDNYVRYPRHGRPPEIGVHPVESAWLDDFEKEEGYKILLSHHPEYWSLRDPVLRKRRIDLVLSGHAHGGQWRLMGRGIFAPGQGLLPKYTSGMHYGPYGRMIVSRGLSNPNKAVPRLGNPCEIVYCIFA